MVLLFWSGFATPRSKVTGPAWVIAFSGIARGHREPEDGAPGVFQGDDG